MRSGDLQFRLTFEKRGRGNDGYGNRETIFTPQFTLWARIRYLRGGEGVIEARLRSAQPAILAVRVSNLSTQISAHWRAVGDGRLFDIKEIPRRTEDRLFLEFLAEAIAADG